VIVTGRLLARIFERLQQPAVIGEVLAGILLGPSLLGDRLSALVLPPDVAPFLGIISQIGILLYMFIVGLEIDTRLLRHRAHTTIAISHASILVPFVSGAALALLLYPRLATRDVPFTSFALFLGTAMSITAFPVLARILSDRGLSRTDLGAIAISCAATDDATAWCLLAVVVGMLFAVRPLARLLVERYARAEQLPRSGIAWLVAALLGSTIATETIGIHAIFGAFMLGAVIPRDSSITRTFTAQLADVVTVLLLPAFFAFTGMRTRIDLVTGVPAWLMCGAIILVATFGKFGGTLLAGRLTGLGWRQAAALGTLMNTRGLMELIVLNIGLDLHVITPGLFSMMVLMAIVTTLTTAPVLRLLGERTWNDADAVSRAATSRLPHHSMP
jgi:Kef-type K+ transport system membrane component KefB